MSVHSTSDNIKSLLRGVAAVIICCIIAVSAVAQSGYRLVVNDANPRSSISKARVADIFLGKTTRWEAGERVRPLDQTVDREVRELFSQDIYGRATSAIKAYWQRQIYSGRGIPPIELTSDEEVLDAVRKDPGAVGYVSESTAIPSGVKPLRIE